MNSQLRITERGHHIAGMENIWLSGLLDHFVNDNSMDISSIKPNNILGDLVTAGDFLFQWS